MEERSASVDAIRLIPYADRRTLATLGKIAQVCVMPGRVGLVAVDAMTLGLPIITTDWPFHAPERDYLTSEFSVVTKQTAGSFAAGVVSVLNDSERRSEMASAARTHSARLSIECTAENIKLAILLATSP